MKNDTQVLWNTIIDRENIIDTLENLLIKIREELLVYDEQLDDKETLMYCIQDVRQEIDEYFIMKGHENEKSI